jgi:phosphoglycolate phosphatase-like HAD superfamily hydrolase
MANILFDWDGTIARPEVTGEASARRLRTIGKNVDKEWLEGAKKNNDQSKLLKELISKYTGLSDDKELKTIMTDIFKYHYLAVVNENGAKTAYDGMFDVVKRLHSTGHKICIASTIRSDIINLSLMKLGMDKFFMKVYANSPDLKYSKRDILEMANKNLGRIDYMIGDKEEDILAGKAVKAKTIYVTWDASSSHKEKPDYSVNKPEELLKILEK